MSKLIKTGNQVKDFKQIKVEMTHFTTTYADRHCIHEVVNHADFRCQTEKDSFDVNVRFQNVVNEDDDGWEVDYTVTVPSMSDTSLQILLQELLQFLEKGRIEVGESVFRGLKLNSYASELAVELENMLDDVS